MNEQEHFNQSGFSLIEVMIGMAIMVVVALAFSQLMFNQAKMQQTISAKTNYSQTTQKFQAAAGQVDAAIKTEVLTDDPTYMVNP